MNRKGEVLMESERLTYRAYVPEDFNTLHRLFNEEARRKWFYFQEPDCLTEEFAHKVIQDSIAVWSRPVNILKDLCGFGIVLKETGELIGNVDLVKCRGDEILDYVNIGYQIGEKHQGKGYATEAVKTAVQWGFERLEELAAEKKIIGDVEHENWGSRKVLEKAGFTLAETKQYLSVYELTKI
jgi:Acetyltransferases, including N-acetylases of ribosomal proteins